MDSFETKKVVAAVLIALLVIKGANMIAHAAIQPKIVDTNAFKMAGASSNQSASVESTVSKSSESIEPLLGTATGLGNASIKQNCVSCHGNGALKKNRMMNTKIPHKGSWSDYDAQLQENAR